MNGPEFRAVEFRAEQTGDGRTLEGYGAVFDTPARIQDWFGSWYESIARGAFKKTLRAKTPVLQFDHGRDARTGSVPIGSINELTEDERGLFVRARLFENPVVEPIRQAIEGGAIDGMSFRFNVTREEWRDADGKKLKPEEIDDLLWVGTEGIQRTIQEVELHELGPVVFPAYDATSVGVRSMLSKLDPEERAALVKEVVAELRRLPDLTGRPAGAVGGGDSDAEEKASPVLSRKRAHQNVVLKTYGVIE
ncbi:HK97 family phage prohead protease [Kribbella sp. NPDC050470]|uniref:HK97 family phage prohead protease n=1 Tax=unclassified Kribbella TaxID=2644121 RepID=UPI0037B19896